MISQLHGTLVEATMSSAVVDVSGVGFELGISGSTAATLPAPGGEVRLYTRMQVREDAMTLFGFASKDERTMFDRLVSVSGPWRRRRRRASAHAWRSPCSPPIPWGSCIPW